MKMIEYTQKNFEKDFQEALEIVDKVGYNECMKNHYILILVPKMKSLGRCTFRGYGNYEIKLNQLYASTCPAENVINTLIHEILHSLPGGMKHTGEWKIYAETVYRKTGIKIQRLASSEECAPYRKEKTLMTIEKHPEKVVYSIYCDGCNRKLETVERRTKAVQHLLAHPTDNTRYYCPKCHSTHLSIKTLPYSDYMKAYLDI